jgi:hypothetical protein
MSSRSILPIAAAVAALAVTGCGGSKDKVAPVSVSHARSAVIGAAAVPATRDMPAGWVRSPSRTSLLKGCPTVAELATADYLARPVKYRHGNEQLDLKLYVFDHLGEAAADIVAMQTPETLACRREDITNAFESEGFTDVRFTDGSVATRGEHQLVLAARALTDTGAANVQFVHFQLGRVIVSATLTGTDKATTDELLAAVAARVRSAQG